MEYPLITHTLDLLRERLAAMTGDDGAPLFQEVRPAVITSYENLFEVIPELTFFPCAILAAGVITPTNMAATREVEIAVLVIDEFKPCPTDLSGITLIEKTAHVLSGDNPGQALKIENIHFVFDSITPLELDAQHTGWNITLIAKMSFIR